MPNWNEKIISFNNQLELSQALLPKDVGVLNPFAGENAKRINKISQQFYGKFYNDANPRKLILGINPGRLGAGATGIPFSDTKRLAEFCNISVSDFKSHEPSSEFVYKVISAYGGVGKFYDQFYIGSVCPLGFVIDKGNGKAVNYNYYDDKKLETAVTPFIIESIEKQLKFSVTRNAVFCLGTGKNYKFLKKLNDEKHWFKKVVPLEHPRYVMQYKRKSLDLYLEKFVRLLGE